MEERIMERGTLLGNLAEGDVLRATADDAPRARPRSESLRGDKDGLGDHELEARVGSVLGAGACGGRCGGNYHTELASLIFLLDSETRWPYASRSAHCSSVSPTSLRPRIEEPSAGREVSLTTTTLPQDGWMTTTLALSRKSCVQK